MPICAPAICVLSFRRIADSTDAAGISKSTRTLLERHGRTSIEDLCVCIDQSFDNYDFTAILALADRLTAEPDLG